jgi:hypothetical protein
VSGGPKLAVTFRLASLLGLTLVGATWAEDPARPEPTEQSRGAPEPPDAVGAVRSAGRQVAQASRSVTGPCAGVLHWLRQEGEEGWLRRCRTAGDGRGMTYGGATHSCREWIAICRRDPGYLGGPVRSR